VPRSMAGPAKSGNSRRPLAHTAVPLLTALALVASAPGCGGSDDPVEVRLEEDTREQTVLGFPALATKNTTRVGGEDVSADAGGTATAVYAGQSEGTRPLAVTLVDEGEWRAGIAAAALMAPPLRAPVLLTDGADLPAGTSTALDTLTPKGARDAGGVQAIEVGRARAPDHLRSRRISGGDQFELAAAIDAFKTRVAGRPSANVVVAPADEPKFAMPAAAWAAKSGDAVLFVERDQVPRATRRAIARHEQPGIYVLGPESAISGAVERSLQRLGRVKRIAGRTPEDNAVAFARYADGRFGWGVRDPGHGLLFANANRTLDAAAAAALAGSGKYGPLLLLEDADLLPPRLESYLRDIQPGYRFDPVRGVYNHGWLLGDESAIGVGVQARIDELLEIVRVRDEGL
jgi:ell wall binding domain 2 (CWB2)